ncbi:MFS transporter, partial [Nocardia gipuzkoensis]
LITLAAMTAYGLQISSEHEDLTLLAMTVPVLVLGFGLGMISGPLADLTLAEVPHDSAGSASGLFNTALQLGYALGVALNGLVFFAATSGSPEAAPNRDAFTDVLWWVGGTLIAMWALMFLLPQHANNEPENSIRQ